MRITGLHSESRKASASTLAQASGRDNHVKDSVSICTANKLATAAFKSPGQALNRSDTESRNTDPKALMERSN